MSYYGCCWMVIGALLLWTMFRRLHQDFKLRQTGLDARIDRLASLLNSNTRYTADGFTIYLQSGGSVVLEIETRGEGCCTWEPIYFEGKWCVERNPEVDDALFDILDALEETIEERNAQVRLEEAARAKARSKKLLERMKA
jgi:hypothetical protein